jgi:hypothetical protein
MQDKDFELPVSDQSDLLKTVERGFEQVREFLRGHKLFDISLHYSAAQKIVKWKVTCESKPM